MCQTGQTAALIPTRNFKRSKDIVKQVKHEESIVRRWHAKRYTLMGRLNRTYTLEVRPLIPPPSVPRAQSEARTIIKYTYALTNATTAHLTASARWQRRRR